MQNQYEDAKEKLEQAQQQFTQIGSKLGAAQCLQGLGNILRMQNQYEDAKEKLEQAQQQFTQIGDKLGAAQCLQNLEEISSNPMKPHTLLQRLMQKLKHRKSVKHWTKL
jgi:tetratricopeptide (TPR) repeat protein